MVRLRRFRMGANLPLRREEGHLLPKQLPDGHHPLRWVARQAMFPHKRFYSALLAPNVYVMLTRYWLHSYAAYHNAYHHWYKLYHIISYALLFNAGVKSCIGICTSLPRHCMRCGDTVVIEIWKSFLSKFERVMASECEIPFPVFIGINCHVTLGSHKRRTERSHNWWVVVIHVVRT